MGTRWFDQTKIAKSDNPDPGCYVRIDMNSENV
jgi:hypothetical protein